jgi:hypothetical protein
VKPNVTRGGRTTYHAECVDPSAFIGEFIERMQRGDRSMVRFI